MPRPRRTNPGPGAGEVTLTSQDLSGMAADQLRATVEDLEAALLRLHRDERGELRVLSDDEQADFDAKLELVSKAREHLQIRQAYARGGIETAFGAPALVPSRGQVAAGEVLRMAPDQVRAAALRILEDRAGHLKAGQLDQVAHTVAAELGPENPNLDGLYVSQRMVITESEAYRSAFQRVLTEAQPLLTEAEVQAVRAYQRLEATRSMAENVTTAGGFGVPVTIDPSILLSSGAEAAPLLAAARIVPTTSNVWRGVSSAPVSFVFQTEGAVTTDNSPTLAQPSITVHMARAFVPYSIEVGQDYPSFAEEMAQLLEQGWTDSLADKTINGTGSGEPFGILTRLDATAGSEVVLTTAGTLDAAQIFKAWNAVPERFRSRARWLMSVSAESTIRSFGAGPNPSAYFTVDLTQDGISRLNGRPVIVTDYMPTHVVGATGHKNHLIVGDTRNYVIAMRQGLAVEGVPTVFQQQTAGTGIGYPTGQRGFFAWGRWGADCSVTQGLRLLNQT
jgi:HK97 family phage major capsid protein